MSSGMSGIRDAARTPHALESEQACRNLTPAPWWLSSLLVALAVEVLPTIEDEVAVDLIEQLAVLVVERGRTDPSTARGPVGRPRRAPRHAV